MPQPVIAWQSIKTALWATALLLFGVTAAILGDVFFRNLELKDLEARFAGSTTGTSTTATSTSKVEDQLHPAIVEPPANPLEIGISAAEVMRRIGIPTNTEGDTWYYGDSAIVFTDGCVVGWEDRPPYPLGKRTDPVFIPGLEQTRGFTCR